MLRIYIFLIIVAILGGVGYGAYAYYMHTQETIRILTENNTKLEMAIKQSEEAIKAIQENYEKAAEENRKINEAYAEVRRQNNRLSSKLANMDLGLIAAEKPDSIERAINKGTKNAGRCFELLSGAPLTEDEKNAKDAETFNKECPWLWPGPAASGVPGEQQSAAAD